MSSKQSTSFMRGLSKKLRSHPALDMCLRQTLRQTNPIEASELSEEDLKNLPLRKLVRLQRMLKFDVLPLVRTFSLSFAAEPYNVEVSALYESMDSSGSYTVYYHVEDKDREFSQSRRVKHGQNIHYALEDLESDFKDIKIDAVWATYCLQSSGLGVVGTVHKVYLTSLAK